MKNIFFPNVCYLLNYLCPIQYIQLYLYVKGKGLNTQESQHYQQILNNKSRNIVNWSFK